MFCGFAGVVSAIKSDFLNAAWMILIAMIFDLMDGRIARLTRTTSKFGVEYDSLSDLISFGLAPAIISYLWVLTQYGRIGWLVAFFYLACAALRLARFNIMTDVVPKNYFQGLPSPFAAASLMTFIIFINETKMQLPSSKIVFGLLLFIGSLMISTIRFPSFKELKIKKENTFGVLAVGVLALILIAVNPEIALFTVVYLYVFAGFITGTIHWFMRDASVDVKVHDEKLQ